MTLPCSDAKTQSKGDTREKEGREKKKYTERMEVNVSRVESQEFTFISMKNYLCVIVILSFVEQIGNINYFVTFTDEEYFNFFDCHFIPFKIILICEKFEE